MVNILRKEGFVFGLVWPDINYEAMDRIIFEMKKPIDDESFAQVFVHKDGMIGEVYVNASEENLGCCDLTGRRPALKDGFPYERIRS